jgi:hypothetical protein
MKITRAHLFGLLAIAHVVGCGGSPPAPSFTPVSGKVLYKGKPLTKGTLILEPQIGGKDATAGIKPDDTFTLGTVKEGDGTVPGPYIAYVTGLNRSQLELKYAQASSSDTTVEIKADQKEYTVEFK